MTYEQQLKDDRWILKREEIIRRDFGICSRCMSSKNIQVHHKYYIEGRMAWEYPNGALELLCDKCHKEHHHDNGIDVQKSEKVPELMSRVYGYVRDYLGILKNESKTKNNG